MSKKQYRSVEDFMIGAVKTSIQEDIERQLYVEDLLSIYSEEYVASCFKISKEEIKSTLERCDPAKERRDELARIAAEAEVLHMVVGCEYFSNLYNNQIE